ncbi:MAG: hypothetical protein COB40_05350 [Marinosulfonomonas sp.]|nr:MAG: hypothetical protein COB40_05350 [Marinosulfonomonas sp.]
MTDVAELEKRIAAALERIGAGLGNLTPGQSGANVSELQEALDTERTANAQLSERVLAIKNKQESLVKDMEAEVAKLREELSGSDEHVQKMKRVNRKLRENNRALRDANKQGVGDPELINTGMDAELDALRASRESDRAELDAILVELKPLVEGAASA